MENSLSPVNVHSKSSITFPAIRYTIDQVPLPQIPHGSRSSRSMFPVPCVSRHQIPVFPDIRSLCSLTKLKRATLNTKTNKRETGLTQNSLKPCHPGYNLLNMMLCTGIRLGHNS